MLDGLEVADQPNLQYDADTQIPHRIWQRSPTRSRLPLCDTPTHYSDVFSNTREKPARNRINLNFSLAKNGWSGLLYINNLLDDETMTPRNATNVARFDQLNAPAEIPVEYQYDAQGGPWGSFRMEPNFGRTYGVRLSYNF